MKKSSSELKRIAKSLLLGNYARLIGAYFVIGLISFGGSLIISLVFLGNVNQSLDYSSTSLNALSSFYASFLNVGFMVATLILSLLLSLISVGFTYMILKLCRKEPFQLSDLFYALSHHPDRILVANILKALIIFACFLPGIVVLVLFAASFITSSGGISSMFLLIGILCLIIGIVVAIILMYSLAMVPFLYLDHPEMSALQLMGKSRELMRGHKGRMFYIELSFIGLGILVGLFTFGIGMLWLVPYMEAVFAVFYLNLKGEV